jgi:hypothetical protein
MIQLAIRLTHDNSKGMSRPGKTDRKGQVWVRRSVEFHLTDWFDE